MTTHPRHGRSAKDAKPGKEPPKGESRAANETELATLVAELDDASVAFLLQQAQVLRYNAEVSRLNDEAEVGRKSRRMAQVSGAKELRLERSADGSTWHIVSGGSWKMFSAEEMAALVRMSRGDDAAELPARLHGWFARERRDVLADFGIDGRHSRLLSEIARLLRDSFPSRSPGS